MGKLSIKNNLFLLIALAIIGLTIPAFIILKSQMLNDKKEKTRNLVESAYSVAEYYYKLSKEGNISEEEAKKEALNSIKALRYDKKEYFWVNDSGLPYPKMIMHATNSKLDGKTLDNEKFNCATSMQAGEDGKTVNTDGKKNLFQAFVEVCKEKGSGYVIYEWPKPKEGGGLTDETYPKLSYVKQFEPWGWVIGSGIYIDDLNEAFMSTVFKNTPLILPIIVILLILSFAIIKSVSGSIREVVSPISQLAASIQRGEADLRVRIETKTKNELNEIVKAVNIFIESVRDAIEYAKQNAVENASISTELSQTSLNIGKRVEQDVEIINSIFEDAKIVIGKVSESVKATEKSKANVLEANEALEESRAKLSKMVNEVQNSVEVEMEFAIKLQALANEADKVKEVLSVIGEIADQTNLLALNAAIEAARAGEHGRGFAVVADEVRKLAERTQKSLQETNATISSIVQAINDAAEQMSENAEDIKSLGNNSVEIEESIEKTVEIMHATVETISSLTESSVTNANQIQQISTMLEKINQTAHVNSRSVEEIASSAEYLSRMTESLNQRLKQFAT